jgi:hypothetical protein
MRAFAGSAETHGLAALRADRRGFSRCVAGFHAALGQTLPKTARRQKRFALLAHLRGKHGHGAADENNQRVGDHKRIVMFHPRQKRPFADVKPDPKIVRRIV